MNDEKSEYVNVSDCVIVFSQKNKKYFYAPQKLLFQKEEIDIDLFRSFISNQHLQTFGNITIATTMKTVPMVPTDYFRVGNIYIQNTDNSSHCLLCKKRIPFDLEFYSTTNEASPKKNKYRFPF